MWESTPKKPIQPRTRGHKDAKVEHDKNKCCADSTKPHLETHGEAFEDVIPQVTKFNLVGNLSRSSRHAKNETFKGT